MFEAQKDCTGKGGVTISVRDVEKPLYMLRSEYAEDMKRACLCFDERAKKIEEEYSEKYHILIETAKGLAKHGRFVAAIKAATIDAISADHKKSEMIYELERTIKEPTIMYYIGILSKKYDWEGWSSRPAGACMKKAEYLEALLLYARREAESIGERATRQLKSALSKTMDMEGWEHDCVAGYARYGYEALPTPFTGPWSERVECIKECLDDKALAGGIAYKHDVTDKDIEYLKDLEDSGRDIKEELEKHKSYAIITGCPELLHYEARVSLAKKPATMSIGVGEFEKELYETLREIRYRSPKPISGGYIKYKLEFDITAKEFEEAVSEIRKKRIEEIDKKFYARLMLAAQDREFGP